MKKSENDHYGEHSSIPERFDEKNPVSVLRFMAAAPEDALDRHDHFKQAGLTPEMRLHALDNAPIGTTIDLIQSGERYRAERREHDWYCPDLPPTKGTFGSPANEIYANSVGVFWRGAQYVPASISLPETLSG